MELFQQKSTDHSDRCSIRIKYIELFEIFFWPHHREQ
jgi:hypothetical protein